MGIFFVFGLCVFLLCCLLCSVFLGGCVDV